jgi:hypothetical protein
MLFTASLKLNSIYILSMMWRLLNVAFVCAYMSHASAELRLSKDWNPELLPHHTVELEIEKLKVAEEKTALLLSSVISPSGKAVVQFNQAFKLYLDNNLYYVDGAMFVPKRHEGDVCTPKLTLKLNYDCAEGQRYAKKAHLLFFNNQFESIGTYQLKINVPYEYYTNAIPAMGVYNKDRNELLATVQYFPIDRKITNKVDDVSSGWKRITVLLRLKIVDGKIEVEQDDACLKNPNSIETITDARKALKYCK